MKLFTLSFFNKALGIPEVYQLVELEEKQAANLNIVHNIQTLNKAKI